MSRRVLQAFGGGSGDINGAVALSVQRLLEACGSAVTRSWCSSVVQQDESRVLIQRSLKDPSGGVTRRTLQSFLFDAKHGLRSGGPSLPLAASVVAVAPSPSGRTLAILRSETEGKSVRVIAELWCSESGSLLRSITADDLVFGAALGPDGTLSDGLSWSPCERFASFVSAAPLIAPQSPGGVFTALQPSAREASVDDNSKNAARATIIAGKSADFEASCRDDWGEKFPSIASTRIAVIDWARGICRQLPGAPDIPVAAACTPAFAIVRGETAIVYVGVSASPRRLGLASCNNRPSRLYLAQLDQSSSHKALTPVSMFARSARVSQDGRHVAFLAASKDAKSFHSASSHLAIIDLADEETVIKTYAMGSERWPGIYAPSLPVMTWAPDNKSVFVNTQRFARAVMCRIWLDGRPDEIEEPCMSTLFPNASINFCGSIRVGNSLAVLASTSSPVSPERLFFAWARHEGPPGNTWLTASIPPILELPFAASKHEDAPETAASSIEKLDFRTFSTFPTPASVMSSSDGEPFESILVWSRAAEAAAANTPGLPLLVVPHGGPHAAFTTSMIASHAVYASLGYAVLAVNYRGSTGYGDGALASLPGRAGRADVSDVFQATIHALALGGCERARASPALAAANAMVEASGQMPRLNASRVAIIGGSHGGFIGAHLFTNPGTRPLFRAAILRNPVINIASMASSTDIPDWCWSTTMGADVLRDGARPPPLTKEALLAMFEASPIALMAHSRLRGDAIDGSAAESNDEQRIDVALEGFKMSREAPDSLTALSVASAAKALSNCDDGTAVLILLGGKDRRVPPSQGFELFYSLRERRESAHDSLRLLVYDNDGHALDSAPTEGDSLVAIVEYLAKWV